MTPASDFITRRTFAKHSAQAAAALWLATSRDGMAAGDGEDQFVLDYILASCLYGELPLAEIVPAALATGARSIDIWPRRHGNQREQLDAMGEEAFLELLQAHEVQLGIITRYDLGPFKLQDELRVLKRLGGKMIVCGSGKGEGKGLQEDMGRFMEQMKPHVALAEELGVVIAIENHGNSLLNTPDSLKYFVELNPSPHLGIAFAPYHLPQDATLLGELVQLCGAQLKHFYAWEHGHGSQEPLPKALEMQQLPGYGPLDFTPMLAALEQINYTGWTSIFMHPVPRGIPILPTAQASTDAINRSREYLEYCLERA